MPCSDITTTALGIVLALAAGCHGSRAGATYCRGREATTAPYRCNGAGFASLDRILPCPAPRSDPAGDSAAVYVLAPTCQFGHFFAFACQSGRKCIRDPAKRQMRLASRCTSPCQSASIEHKAFNACPYTQSPIY